jgi:phosphotriesterase-related protein
MGQRTVAKLRTVLGDVDAEKSGIILPHEHLFCDLRPLRGREPVRENVADVELAELSMLHAAREAGVTTLVEPTPPGIGRDPLLLRRIAEHSFVDVIAATGLYKEPLLPRRAYERSIDDLASWFAFEISVGILPVAGDSHLGVSLLGEQALGRANDELSETPVQAGVIKLAASNEGLQAVEAKALRAAVQAAEHTGAAIISHSPSGAAFQQQLDVLEEAGGDPGRFVQVHANAEKDFSLHLRALQRGAWVEYDGIGSSKESDDRHLQLVLEVIRAGFADRLLISQDVVGWRAGAPGGGNVDETGKPKRRYGYLVTDFLPRLREAGVPEETIRQITVENPRSLLALATT